MQVYEKYVNLARDAASSGDRIAAESYQQYAEHYYRIINDTTDPQRPAQQNAGAGGAERTGADSSEAEQPVPERGGRDRKRGAREPYPADAEQPFVDGEAKKGAATPAPAAAAEGNGQVPEAAAAAKEDGDAAEESPPEEAKPKARGRGRPRTRAKASNGAAAKSESDGAAAAEAVEPCKAGEASG